MLTAHERATLEAQRRVAVLPAEIDAWVTASTTNAAGLGIHRSQIAALRDMLDELVGRQRDLLAQRPAPEASAAYAEAELALGEEIVGSYELWSVFRSSLDQRRDPAMARLLDAADLVAADAYRACLERARSWGIVTDDEFREPPLVCLEPVHTPETAARGKAAAGLSATIQRYRSQRLPIPIVRFPSDRVRSPWFLTTLAHEVGHDVDADLALAGEVADRIETALAGAGVSETRRASWADWSGEMVADGIGIALAGAAFAGVLADWLLVLAPAARFGEPSGGPHPPHYLRVRLLAAMLRAAGVAAWTDTAASLEAAAEAGTTPAWEKPFGDDVATVAQAVVGTDLAALADHSLLELATDPAADSERATTLAAYLRTGFNRPPPGGPPAFPFRLVPVAAEQAVRAAGPAADLEAIGQRTIDFLHAIPRPQFLAAGAAATRRAFLRRLAARIDVRQHGEAEPALGGPPDVPMPGQPVPHQ